MIGATRKAAFYESRTAAAIQKTRAQPETQRFTTCPFSYNQLRISSSSSKESARRRGVRAKPGNLFGLTEKKVLVQYSTELQNAQFSQAYQEHKTLLTQLKFGYYEILDCG